jgi:hypothetical protein
MAEKKRRCGASLPDRDAEENQHYCYHPAGHAGWHEDDVCIWKDGDTVSVHTVEELPAVSHHTHDFVGDEDTCVSVVACPLTWGQFTAQQREWEAEQADTCSFCGHAEHCHTFEARDEGGRDYRTECGGAKEFHSFNEEPKAVVPSRERLLEFVRSMLGPDASPEHVERVAHRVQLVVGPLATESAPAAQPALRGPRGPGSGPVIMDEVAQVQDALKETRTDG